MSLARRGLGGAEAIFLMPRKTPGDREFERWIQDLADTNLRRCDEELASALQLILNQGPSIHTRLNKDERFRGNFHAMLWPKLARVAANNNMFASFLDEPLLWEFLTPPDSRTKSTP